MSFDDIQKTWQSSQNQPDLSEMENHRATFLAKLVFAVVTFLALALPTGAMALHLMRPDGASTSIELSREWERCFR